jgi:uncharacterized protein (DUF1501 family)
MTHGHDRAFFVTPSNVEGPPMFSEFGRRVARNASNGTDHGTARPLFMLAHRSKAEPAASTDFRSVYATVLDRWLGRNSTEILGATFAPMNIV